MSEGKGEKRLKMRRTEWCLEGERCRREGRVIGMDERRREGKWGEEQGQKIIRGRKGGINGKKAN